MRGKTDYMEWWYTCANDLPGLFGKRFLLPNQHIVLKWFVTEYNLERRYALASLYLTTTQKKCYFEAVFRGLASGCAKLDFTAKSPQR